ncbi:uncharacterized protein PV09_08142 [Verruconis gallopava]|uniref:histidine kinase n=1 Tax=Verruconis gallopava TaxID=253628 RepID=A0A0D1XDD8_9PEZI|nr:uncharacterized protein PV09_08142 [Verruconis gallopava]KIW00251.1 hypothetical protein PV09_08142 [Verruconis gallopava]
MPPRRDGVSTMPLDTNNFLEHLPLPCLFVAANGTIAFANAAARLLIQPLILPRCNVSCLLDGTLVLDNELSVALGLPAKSAIEQYLQELRESRERKSAIISAEDTYKTPIITLPTARCGSGLSSLTWAMAYCDVECRPYCSFTGIPTPNIPAGPEEKRPTEEEDWEMLQTIAAPTFNSPNLMCSIMTASQASHKLNDRGRQFLSGTESYPWTLQHVHTKHKTTLTDPEFTRQLPAEEGAAITSLSRRQALLNCRRGLEDPLTGTRNVFNASTILLNRPNSNDLLGVIVCVEPEEFSLYVQRYDNLRHTATHGEPTTDWNRARLIRSITLDGEVDFVSTAWTNYTGLEAKALHGSRWFNCLHPDDRQKFVQTRPASSTVARSRECEIRIRGRDGLYRWFSDRTEPMYNEDGHFVRWYSISEDIHDLVMKREQAHADKFVLQKIFAELDVFFFAIDANYIVTAGSGSMEFGDLRTDGKHDSRSMIGQNLLEFIESISPGGIPALQRALVDVMTGNSSKEIVEYSFGSLYIRTIIIPHVDEDQEPHSKDRIKGLVGASIDITAAREHDEVKAQMKAMEETSRLKSEFLANVSHELRTPIAGLTGLVELLLETRLDHQQIDLLESIQSSAHRLLQIVNDILDFSKSEASAIVLECIPFSLTRFFNEVCKSNRLLATRKGLEFLSFQAGPDIQLMGDTGRIRQILENLLTNAMKFTSQGYVKLSTSYHKCGDMVRVEFLIEDTGIGIEKEDVDKLFLPFVQADQSTTRIYGGSGLGLSIARKMAEIMGGSVTLQSTKNVGTKAKVTLLLATASTLLTAPEKVEIKSTLSLTELADATSSESPNLELSSQKKEDLHILFVEDNEINRKVMMAHLASMGFKKVDVVHNGAEALSYMSKTSPPVLSIGDDSRNDAACNSNSKRPSEPNPRTSWPDIILMDCQMPVMDGYQATQQLRKLLHYDRPIIALTASAIEGDREKCLVAGMDDHVAKPVSRKQLLNIINKWTSNPAQASPTVRQRLGTISRPD